MRAKKLWKAPAKRSTKERHPLPQAAEFVREEIEHIREGKHGARSSPEWHEDKAYVGVILRTISVWRGVNLMTGFGKKGGRHNCRKR
jgi:hypothetical protein